ncbi:MAG: Gfo/Idh/MocA family oxidoreductase [Deltaproteobacteria bacterium]|nr:MAG: Gfo/Idh/MocA family oxidoreductase [Deltaproteobacteria bacterium]
MSQSLRVAVIGTGFIGPVHVEALRRLGFETVGLLGSSSERARPKAEELGVERTYASLDDLVADESVDVVHITSPNKYHYPQAKAALGAGKHVICEKPLAMNAQESAELLELANARNLVHAVNFNIRFYPLNQHARQLIADNELGKLYIIRGHYVQDWLLYDTDWNWRLETELGGSLRAVGDIGSHWLDLTSFITGLKVKRVLADFETFLPVRRQPTESIDTFAGRTLSPADYQDREIKTEDYATIVLHYEGGARGVVTVSQVCAGRKNQLFYEISGAQKAIAWDSERPNELWIGYRDTPNQVFIKDPSLLPEAASQFADYPGGHNEGFPDTFKQLYKAVYRYIQAGDFDATTDFPTFADGHEEMVLAEAIESSARTGSWVDIEP